MLGQQIAIRQYLAIQSSNVTMPVERFAELLVRIEIDAGSPGVGPPIDVWLLDKDGITHSAKK